MKIAIISDWHLGHNWGTELEMDSFSQLAQAISQIEAEKAELILVAGDLFDKATPSQEVFYEAIRLLDSVKISNKIGIRSKDNKELKLPIICLIGNHEFRGKDYKSSVELLELLGFVRFLHCSSVTLENNAEKLFVYGISGVPEKYALDVLKKCDPKPMAGHYNIFMMHQSIAEYLPFEDEMIASISLSNLPSGFDLIVNGHLHWSILEKLENGATFMMPGSTVLTQIKKKDVEKGRGFYILDSKTNKIDFQEIKNARSATYIDLTFKQATIEEVLERISQELKNILQESKTDKKPLVRIRIKGELKHGFFARDLNLRKIEEQYPDLLISFSNNLQEKTLKESIDKLKELQKSKSNLKDASKEIFLEQIKQTNASNSIDYERLYDLLQNGDLEKAKELVVGV